MAEISYNPGRNPKASQDILAASKVRLGEACYSSPWGCLKHTGGLQISGYSHILQSDIATHDLLQTKPAPSPLGLCACLLPQAELVGIPNPSCKSVPRERSVGICPGLLRGLRGGALTLQDVKIEGGFSFFPEAVAMPTG